MSRTGRGHRCVLASFSLLLLLILLLFSQGAGSQNAGEGGGGAKASEEVACPSACGTCSEEIVRCENSNGMEAVPAALPHNDTLRELVITGGCLTVVNASAFRNLRSLRKLDLTNDQIDNLTDGALKDLSLLHTLILRRNFLRSLTNETFAGLGNLKVLELSYNLLEQLINWSFQPLVGLEVLDLMRNNISYVERDTFSGLSNLKVLNLTRNNLVIVSHYFAPLLSLQLLIVEENDIRMVMNKSFTTLQQLKRLTLMGNRRLGSLPPHAFVSESVPGLGCVALEELSLRGTGLTEVPVQALEGLGKLRSLDLSQTSIARVRRGSFQNLTSLVSLTMDALKHLTSIEKDAFTGLRSLEHLAVTNNRNLTGLSSCLFCELTSLKYLDLKDNGLQTVHPEQANWKDIDVVDLSGNPIQCDCQAAWMLLFLVSNAGNRSAANDNLSTTTTPADDCSSNEGNTAETPSSDYFARQIACSGPSQLRSRCLASLSPEEFQCESSVVATETPKKKTDNDYRFRVGIIASVLCVLILFTFMLVIKFRTRIISVCSRQYRYKSHKYREQNGGSLSPEIVELETTQLEDFESDIDTSMKP